MDPVPTPEPPWMATARALIGTREVKGPQHSSAVVRMFDRIHSSWIRDDETPWCAAYVGACLEDAGFESTRRPNAKSYLTWGRRWAGEPRWPAAYGAIVVLDRPPRAANGHVGFLVHGTTNLVYLLGGNQDDCVCVRGFPWSRIAGSRWPNGYPCNYTPPDTLVSWLIGPGGAARSEA